MCREGEEDPLPGVNSQHGGQDLLESHGEGVGYGHRGPPHDLDDQGRQGRGLEEDYYTFCKLFAP